MRLFSDGHPVLGQDSVLDISIIGAGVSGLSTGIRLLEAGHDVTIFTESISPDTVSDTATVLGGIHSWPNHWKKPTSGLLKHSMN